MRWPPIWRRRWRPATWPCPPSSVLRSIPARAVLTRDPADIRIEAGPKLRADGMDRAAPYHGPQDALALARWFLDRGGAPDGRGRMAA